MTNHAVETEQKHLLVKQYGVSSDGFIILDEKSKNIWSNIDPAGDLSELYEIKKFILSNTDQRDYVLVQGEHGATYNIVDFCFKIRRIPIHATSKRESKEYKIKGSQIEKVSMFKLINHREYKKDE